MRLEYIYWTYGPSAIYRWRRLFKWLCVCYFCGFRINRSYERRALVFGFLAYDKSKDIMIIYDDTRNIS